MNWLAHLHLSEPTPEFRLGNLLPDFNRPGELSNLSPEILRGIECHHRIDAFTDQHPLVRQSICRISPPFRRYGGVLIDLFYDHFLAANWVRYSSNPLEDFLHEVHSSFEQFYPRLPQITVTRFQTMRAENWLGSYATFEGMEVTLARVSRRFQRSINLAPAIEDLKNNYRFLQADFEQFFPELKKTWIRKKATQIESPSRFPFRFLYNVAPDAPLEYSV